MRNKIYEKNAKELIRRLHENLDKVQTREYSILENEIEVIIMAEPKVVEFVKYDKGKECDVEKRTKRHNMVLGTRYENSDISIGNAFCLRYKETKKFCQ